MTDNDLFVCKSGSSAFWMAREIPIDVHVANSSRDKVVIISIASIHASKRQT